MLADLGAIVTLLGDTTISVERFAAGAHVAGVFVEGAADTPFEIAGCSLQPLPGNEVALLPEGTRTRDARLLFTPGQVLQAPSSEGGHRGDRVTAGGEVFRVVSVQDWLTTANYGRAVLVEETGVL